MPDTPASIISLNFGAEGLDVAKAGAKELEGIFGRIGGIAEGMTRNLAGLAGVAGLGALVHQFLQVEQSATRTALAVNNIRGGSAMTTALFASQGATGVDAIDLAGGINASQRFAGGSFLRSSANAGNYATFLGHGSQATGLSAATLGQLLGQGMGIQGQGVSQQGAQGLLSMAYTAAARAGQGGMSGPILQSLMGLVNQTGFFGGGRNIRGMTAAMGAAMKGDHAFADPATAAGAVGSVEGVIQGSLTDPRMMAALQMSGANVNDVLNGDFGAAQKLARFAKKQGPLASKLFFYSRFGQQGGRLMEDMANGKIDPETFKKKMAESTPEGAMRSMMERSAAAEKTGLSELKKFEGNVMTNVAGPLKHIENMLASILGHKGLVEGALGLYGASKVGGLLFGRGALKRGAGGILRGLGARSVGGAAGVDAAEALGLGGIGAATGGLIAGSGILGFGLGEHLLDKTGRYKHAGPLGLLRRNKSDEELDLDKLGSLESGLASGYRKARNKEAYLKAMLQDYRGDGSEVGFKIVELLSQMLASLKDPKKNGGATNQGAAFMGGGGVGGSVGGLELASFRAGASGGAITSVFPGGGVRGATQSQSISLPVPSGGPGVAGGDWQDCTLTWYDPALGGTNSGTGKKDPHAPTASGDPYDPNKHTCAAPPAYGFGTRIEFSYGGKKVTCVVNDRGGAITGNHFDLSRSAGTLLGIGNSRGKFRVLGGGGGGKKGSGKSGGGTVHLPPGAVQPGAQAQTSSAGGSFGGASLGGGFGGGGGGGGTVNVYLDNRLIEKSRHRVRAM